MNENSEIRLHIANAVAEKVRDALETQISNVSSISVEPCNITEESQTPLIGILIADNIVIERPTGNAASENEEVVKKDGQFFLQNSDRCCTDEPTVRQFFLIEVLVEQCANAHNLCGAIGQELEDILDGLFANWFYDGFRTQRSQGGENQSSKFHVRQYQYYVEYKKTKNVNLTHLKRQR